MKPRRPEPGIIGAVAQNSGHFFAAGLTRDPLDYFIRASASQAQVAQSLEQRTENTGTVRLRPHKFKKRNGFG